MDVRHLHTVADLTDAHRPHTVADLTVGLHLRRAVAHTDAPCLCRPMAVEATVAAGLPLRLTAEVEHPPMEAGVEHPPMEAGVVAPPCPCPHTAEEEVTRVDSAAVAMLPLVEVTVVVAEAEVTIAEAEAIAAAVEVTAAADITKPELLIPNS